MRRVDRSLRELIALEVDEELCFHVQMRTEENERAGMSPDEARRKAVDRFGDFDRIARASRFQRLAPPDPIGPRGPRRRLTAFLDTLRQDMVHALRGFALAPALFVAATLTLAIGLGATTAIYSLANYVLLRPVPGVEAPDQLSDIWTGQSLGEGSFRPSMLSNANFADVAARTQHLSGLAGYQIIGLSAATAEGESTRLLGHAVTGSYFDVLGVEAQIGRVFRPGDGIEDTNAAVISHRTWHRLFNASPEVVGKTLRLNGSLFTAIGVVSEEFKGPDLLAVVDVWLHGDSYGSLRHAPDPARYQARERGWFYHLIGRLAPGSTWDQVDAELDSLEAWLAAEFPEVNSRFAEVGFHVFRSFGTRPLGRSSLTSTLTLLMAVGSLVLLIACANVANLLLARGLGRTGEVALRKALGAGRPRIMRAHLTEGILLWLAGGVAGLGVARLMIVVFEGSSVGFASASGIGFDLRVIGFAAVSSLLVGAVFAVAPAVAASRVAPAGSLALATATGSRRSFGLRSALTVLQLSASLVLLVGTLLLVRSLANITSVYPGFEPEGVYAVLGSTDDLGYSAEESFQYYQEFARRLEQMPEIDEVAVVTRSPFLCCGFYTRVLPAGEPFEDRDMRILGNTVIFPGFFSVMEIPLLYGRVFTESDISPPGGQASQRVVLSESLAVELFGHANAVGRAVEYGQRSRAGKQFEVIGIVADVHYEDLSEPPEPTIYEPSGLGDFPISSAYLLLKAEGRAQVGSIVADIARQLDDGLPVQRVTSIDVALADARSQRTLLAKLMSLLAAFAALLAAVGLYGVVAFAVRAREREFGIRLALGAEARQVFRLVLSSIAGVTIVGLIIGLGGAVALARALESSLFGVAPFDPLLWASSAFGLVMVALGAAFLPSRRATRTDPVKALRSL